MTTVVKPLRRPNRERPLDKYRRWWLGRRVRLRPHRGPFRLVLGVQYIGHKSGRNGTVVLRFADGVVALKPDLYSGKPPSKQDVEVEVT